MTNDKSSPHSPVLVCLEFLFCSVEYGFRLNLMPIVLTPPASFLSRNCYWGEVLLLVHSPAALTSEPGSGFGESLSASTEGMKAHEMAIVCGFVWSDLRTGSRLSIRPSLLVPCEL